MSSQVTARDIASQANFLQVKYYGARRIRRNDATFDDAVYEKQMHPPMIECRMFSAQSSHKAFTSITISLNVVEIPCL